MNDTTWLIAKVEKDGVKVLIVDFAGVKTYSLMAELSLKHKFIALVKGTGHMTKDIHEDKNILSLDFYDRFLLLDDITDVFNKSIILNFYGDKKEIFSGNTLYVFHFFSALPIEGIYKIEKNNCVVVKDTSGEFSFCYEGKTVHDYEFIISRYIIFLMSIKDNVFIRYKGISGFLLKIKVSESLGKTLMENGRAVVRHLWEEGELH